MGRGSGPVPSTVPVHGRSGWLHHGCRCDICRRELVEYAQMRRAVAAVRQGRRPVPRVPARQVRRRVSELRAAGWTVAGIARSAGVSYSTVERIANRRLRNVALTTHAAVLAVGR